MEAARDYCIWHRLQTANILQLKPLECPLWNVCFFRAFLDFWVFNSVAPLSRALNAITASGGACLVSLRGP